MSNLVQARAMKITLAQLDVTPGDPVGNLSRLAAAHAEASTAGADLVIIPEMSDTGYDLSLVRGSAGKVRDEVVALSRDGCDLLAGLAEVRGEQVYNTLTYASDGEERALYRKRHLIGLYGEPAVITQGTEAVAIKIGGLNWGLMICYDLRFPEQARDLVLSHGAEVLCYVAAWPVARSDHWTALLRARAIENQCYAIGVNRVGTDDGVTFCGRSVVVDPHGEVVAEASGDAEELVSAALDPEEVREVRERLPFLRDA